MANILDNQIVFNDRLIIEQGTLQDGGKQYTRLRLQREDAAAVLLYNPGKDVVILTRQFRYPVAFHRAEELLEILAGKVDPGETPLETAIREAEEETGYRIPREKIRFLSSCFASPGYSTERFHLYYAEVKAEDQTGKGGGLEQENESIRTVEISRETFMNMVHEGKIMDAKTLLAALIRWPKS